MARAVDFLTSHYAAGLPLKPGGRKTSITLGAFQKLRSEGKARTMLVVAPLRVARKTWPDEISKWEEFADLKVALLHGPKKDEVLRNAEADVYLINFEGIPWLTTQYFGRPLPFDIIAIDELTKLKNAQSERSKALLPRLKRGPRWRWGLTGSLAGDGDYLDVFGQQLVLDDGAALGRYITWYRNAHFDLGFDGFSYMLRRGHEQQILAKLAPYWFRMDDADYAELPKIVDNAIRLHMTKAQRALYIRMRDTYLASLPEKTITAANAGAAYAKLSQIANGAMYDERRDVHLIHDLKIEALDELVEELNGLPLLVGYEFNHDLTRIQAWHRKRFDKELPYLGKGTTPAQEKAWIDAWNRNELPVLAGHPASMGHGLNLQGGSCTDICHFSLPWSFELYDQFVRRVWRDGNTAERIFNHMLIIDQTIDEDKLAARDAKGFTTLNLVRVLNDEISREERETGSGPGHGREVENETMVGRLSRPSTAAAPVAALAPAPAAAAGWGPQSMTAAPVAAPPAPAAGGWGPAAPTGPAQAVGTAPVGWGAPVADPHAEQREAIRTQIAPNPTPAVGQGFSGALGKAAEAIQSGDYGAPATEAPAAPAPATRKRRTAAEKAADEAAAHPVAEEPAPRVEMNPVNFGVAVSAALGARVDCLKIAFADSSTPLDEGLEVADQLWAWVNKAG
jgi:hypothetical protein